MKLVLYLAKQKWAAEISAFLEVNRYGAKETVSTVKVFCYKVLSENTKNKPTGVFI